jgi:putative aldouronate transport system substrate-binding protein
MELISITIIEKGRSVNMKKFLKNLSLISMTTILGLTFTSCKGGKINTSVDYDVDLNNKIDLVALFPNSGMNDNEFNNGYSAQLINQLTGYKTTYRQLSDSSADNEVTNYLSSQEPINVMKLAEGQYEAHVTKGAFLDLTDLLKKYGQDILATIPKESWDTVTLDGKIYAIPETAFAAMSDCALVFNLDHLKEIGYEKLPETLGELTDVFTKLQAKYSVNNANYHAFGLAGSQPDCTTISSTFELPLEFFENSEGKIENMIYHENFMPYMNYMNSLVRSSVLASSWSTQVGSDIISNFAKGNISVGFMNYWSITPLLELMAGSSNYKSVEEARNAIDWTLRIRGDGTSGSKVQEVAKYRTSIGNAYYVVIPIYMAKNAGYAIDWINTKIKDDNYAKLYGGVEGTDWESTTSDDPDAIAITLNNETNYRKLLPGFNSNIKGNSMYTTGANAKVGAALWPLREKGFGAWNVVTELDETVITNPMSFRPTFKLWSPVSIVGRSYVMTYMQQAINSTREGSKSTQGIIDALKVNFKNKYWTSSVDAEVQQWYSSK